MNLPPIIPPDLDAHMIREMSAVEVLELAFDAYELYLEYPSCETCREYNRWAETYNFKRGKWC